ncbi:hypothetical protein [Acidovorax sp. SUPP3334]|uniref:hypothetical protein n=1 Tax=Acidovorax sp. SUPP3334 TaxID=2920881 RepID=UPI0023DE29C8|nr:hypothetical protein [Acidovorax sp. SUPP3334]GKT24283.1 hypothetical protein AVHM3334_14270 [Acidovorax sp. SUPP3334]
MHQGWMAIGCAVAGLMAGCGDGAVRQVKRLERPDVPGGAVGAALDQRQACAAVQWRSFQDAQGRRVVQYACEHRQATAHYARLTREALAALVPGRSREPGGAEVVYLLHQRSVDFRRVREVTEWRMQAAAPVWIGSWVDTEYASHTAREPVPAGFVFAEAAHDGPALSPGYQRLLERAWRGYRSLPAAGVLQRKLAAAAASPPPPTVLPLTGSGPGADADVPALPGPAFEALHAAPPAAQNRLHPGAQRPDALSTAMRRPEALR